MGLPRLATMLLIAAAGCTAACGTGSDGGQGLTIEFKPLCKEQEVWLAVTMRNGGSGPTTIENGVLPWQYDPVGTSFEAESMGKRLARNPAIPLIGRPGPVHLSPNEQVSGETPIEFMFPEIADLIGMQTVTVRWAYWTAPLADDSKRMKGTIQLTEDPCS